MSALTSLLVRDRVVPVSKIEEALQSQVFLGGDLEIILLEMNLVPEDVLSAYRAALFNLLPATREEVMRASREALRRMSPELARAVGMVPLLFEKRTLVVAAWEPIYEPRLGELEAQLGCELSVRIVNGARLAAGLAHHYGFELDPRLRRLADALRRRDPGVVPYVHPPTPSMRPSMPPPMSLDDDDDEEDDEEDDDRDGVLADAPPRAPEPAVAPAPAPPGPPVAVPHEDDAYVDLEAERAAIPRGVSPELVVEVRAPFSYEAALDLLQRVSSRDDVLFVLLRWVQQFFGFTCIFGVGREGISARMAHGNGQPPDVIERAFIETPRTGLLAQSVLQGRALLGSLGDAHEEHAAAELLQRPPGRLGLAMPLALSGRVVILVYVDDPREPITLEHAELVAPILPAVNEALYRIILEQRNQRIAEALQRDSQPEPAAPNASSAPDEVMAEAPTARMSSIPPGNVASAPTTSLRAVDLDALADDGALASTVARPPSDAPGAAGLRERLPGVPRPAPAPPAQAVGAEEQAVAGEANEDAVEAPEPPREKPAPEPVVQVAPAVALHEATADEGPRRPSLIDVDDQPSVIIDMGESVDALVDALEKAPRDESGRAIDDLLALGEGALPVLVQRFPGPLWFDRNKPHKQLPPSRDVSAVARAMVAFGERAAPYLGSLLGDDDPERCYYALLLARDVSHPDLIEPIAQRLLEPDRALRVLASEVLRGYAGAPQYDAVLRALLELAARPSREAGRQRMAVEVLGVLRDDRALATLLGRLRDPDSGVVQSAHRALVLLTGHDFGASPRKWEAWAEGWGRAHRVEWLIEALLHGEESVRGQAGEELKQLTQQYFGYHPALPRRDRELAQRKYREWWELEGRVAFGR